MRTPTCARAALLLGCLTGATMIVSSAPAHARTVEFPQVPTMFRDGLCGGSVRVWADTDPQWGGRAIFNVKANPIVGYGPGEYSAAPLCENLTTVAWRNVNTGATGEYRVTVVAGIYGSIQYALYQDTGPGHIVVTSYTDLANIPQHGEFDVPA
ncbi:hypothetical protein GFY24_04180 [Nocardia sp. SYP-A9097]|uniref:hypothetical protein n=1 Tax=Nocardia sp. SYP-A9097 TaxID=2663237 RepID=UPI00129B49F5|nr:hypothetical protein [Nocardia sp. SYP-A9097]MRH86674.1 hypothetical protein [Nocardia sp. SYP-A9097]